MSTATLSITRAYPPPEANVEDVWIRLEFLEPESDNRGASVEDASELVDAVFDTDPCEGEEDAEEDAEETEETEEDGEETEQPGDKEISDAMKKTFDLALCNVDLASGTVRSTVHVYQSHPEMPYRLQIEGGTILSQRRITEHETVFLDVDRATDVSIDKPLLECSASWLVCSVTPPPPIKRTGSVLSWGVPCSGRIAAEILASGDEVLISSPFVIRQQGEEKTVTSGEVTLYAFMRGASDMLQYTPAEPQELTKLIELREKFCKEWDDNWTFPPTPEQHKLLHVRRKIYRCQCSGDEAYTEDESAVEPHSIEYYQGGYTGVVYHPEFMGYVDCGEETGDIADPEFYKAVCCEYPVVTLPKCSQLKVKNPGGKALPLKERQKYLRRWAGKGAVQFIAVSPADGDCGTTTYKQRRIPRSCCDAVSSPLAWSPDHLPEVLPHDWNVYLQATGGLNWEPYTWTTSSDATHFTNGKKTLVSAGYAVLVADINFCGTTTVTVSDGCTRISHVIRSDLGEWVSVPWDEGLARSIFQGMVPDSGAVAVRGEYKMREHVQRVNLNYGKVLRWLDPEPYFSHHPGWSKVPSLQEACDKKYGFCFKGPEVSEVDAHIFCASQKVPVYHKDQTILRYNISDSPYDKTLHWLGDPGQSSYIRPGGLSSTYCFVISGGMRRYGAAYTRHAGGSLYRWSCTL